MPKYILILLIVGLQYGYAQKNNSDKSFSQFYGFSLGSTPETFAGDLQLDLEISYGTKYYKYSGKLLRKFKAIKVHDINLGFHEERLIYLDLYFKRLDDNTFDYLLENLSQDYGEPIEFEALYSGIIASYEWKEEGLTAQLYRYNDEASDLADRHMTVLAISIN